MRQRRKKLKPRVTGDQGPASKSRQISRGSSKNFPCSPEVSQTATDKFFNTSNCSAIDDVTEKHAMFENFQKVENECYGAKILAPPKNFGCLEKSIKQCHARVK